MAVVAALAASVVVLAAVDGGAAPGACAGFGNQAAAQSHFVGQGGGPGRNEDGLDADEDGVACEELGRPYKGHATIGWHKGKRFLFGVATMPTGRDGAPRCLYGNRQEPHGPREIKLFRVRPGADRALLPEVPATYAQARPESGKLIWKVERPNLAPGEYYVAFDESIRRGPYEGIECPGFASLPQQLP
jgi:hypothetical protein